jgi:hypothetical protein
MQGTFYKPSGKTPAVFFLYFLVAMAITIPILSIAYVCLTSYIPFIYINVAFTGGAGLIIGAIIDRVVNASKMRSPAICALFTILAVCVFECVQWCA